MEFINCAPPVAVNFYCNSYVKNLRNYTPFPCISQLCLFLCIAYVHILYCVVDTVVVAVIVHMHAVGKNGSANYYKDKLKIKSDFG